jgi:hypothetical protein
VKDELAHAAAAHGQARAEWQRTEAVLAAEIAALKSAVQTREAAQAGAGTKLQELETRAAENLRLLEAAASREESGKLDTARLTAELRQLREEHAAAVSTVRGEQVAAALAPLKKELEDLWREYTEQTEAREREAKEWRESDQALRAELESISAKAREALTAQAAA